MYVQILYVDICITSVSVSKEICNLTIQHDSLLIRHIVLFAVFLVVFIVHGERVDAGSTRRATSGRRHGT